MARQYYYLVSGLPSLFFDHEAKGFDFLQIKEFIRESTHPDDYKLVELLYAPIDIQNIVNIKFNQHKPFIEGGKFNEEELKEELEDPQYLQEDIINQLNRLENLESNEPDTNEIPDDDYITDPETFLLKKLYNYAEQSNNSFIKQWFTFDREIRNIQAAYIARKLNLPIEGQLIGDDDVTEQLAKNTTSDFGLRRDRDYFDKLWQIIENNNLLERERKLDLLRWEYIDELTAFNYFDINAVLAFVQKTIIINRWMDMDDETGLAMFEQLVGELKKSYDAEEAFKSVN